MSGRLADLCGLVVLTARLRMPVHTSFSSSSAPPGVGQTVIYSFTSTVSGEVSLNNGPYSAFTAPATVQIRVIWNHQAGNTIYFDTELLQMDVAGGNLPPGVQVRESPTLTSTGSATIETIPGGYMIDSFFDVFTELRNPVNGNWIPSSGSGRLVLKSNQVNCGGPTIVSARSVKDHGGASGGPFGIDLGVVPAAGQVECRVDGPTRIDVVFNGPIVAWDGSADAGDEVIVNSVPAGAVSITGVTVSGSTLRIDLNGVPNRSCLSVWLHGLACDNGSGSPGVGMADVQLRQRVLLGDVGGNGTVSSADINQVKAHGGTTTAANCRMDVNDDGQIGAADVNVIKGNTVSLAVVCP